MVATYTQRLRLTKQGDNDNPNTWGDVVNQQVIDLVDEAVGGVTQVDVTGTGNINIASTAENGASDDARHAVIELSGTLGADILFIVPSVQKLYLINALWSGAFTVTVQPSGGASGIVFNPGETKWVYVNGTSITEYIATGGLRADNNLSDLDSVPTALTNLGITSVGTTTLTALLAIIYPVGSLYFNASDSTNPATLLGFGTWTSFAAGRVPIGVGTGTDVNSISKTFAQGATGGEYQHTQTIPEIGAHTHTVSPLGDHGSAISQPGGAYYNASGSLTTSSTGSSTPMQWLQPYIAVNIWKRVS